MLKNSTQTMLLQKLMELLEAHRGVFRQERVYWRNVGLVFGELFNFGRHTITQGLMALGITDGDWSAWYRLFSQKRFEEEQLAQTFLGETLKEVPENEPYVVGADGVQIPRSSLKMAGTSWLKAPRTPVFKVGIHRAQRFLHGSWLTPLQEGYSRALPLRFLPAFPPKAKDAHVAPQREWEAGLAFVNWVRQSLDRAGRLLNRYWFWQMVRSTRLAFGLACLKELFWLFGQPGTVLSTGCLSHIPVQEGQPAMGSKLLTLAIGCTRA